MWSSEIGLPPSAGPTAMCLCLQAEAAASASAGSVVIGKKSDIAVPVIIAKKQGECHWCQCQWHVDLGHSCGTERELLDRVLGCSCQVRCILRRSRVCTTQGICAASWAQGLGSCLGNALRVQAVFSDLPVCGPTAHRRLLPISCLAALQRSFRHHHHLHHRKCWLHCWELTKAADIAPRQLAGWLAWLGLDAHPNHDVLCWLRPCRDALVCQRVVVLTI